MSAADGGVRVPAHERLVLANGLTLILVPRRDVPLVAFNAVLRGGESVSIEGKPGLASLVAGLLEKGAGERDAFGFADAVEGVGGTFNAGAGPESITLRGQFLARDQQLMLELLADVLLQPRLDPEELEYLRARQIELIKAAKDSDPSELIGTYGRALLFGEHPYGRPLIGSERSLASITHEDVVRYPHEHFGADRLTLIFAGDIDVDWLTQAVSQAFSPWTRARRAVPILAQAPRLHESRTLLVDSPGSTQTYFWIGNVGVDRHYRERPALDLVNTLFGGRFTSMLNTELRVKSGLSYGARSGFTRGSVAGEFAIRSFVQTQDTRAALDLALRTLGKLHEPGAITPEMLDSARAYVLGQFPMHFETAADWAAALGEIELFRLGARDIEAYAAGLCEVTLAQAESVIAEAFPSSGEVAIVLVGDAARLSEQLSGYGPVTRMLLIQPDFHASGDRADEELTLAAAPRSQGARTAPCAG